MSPECVGAAYSAADADSPEQQSQQIQQLAAAPVLFPDASMRHSDDAAAELDGRLVLSDNSKQPGSQRTTALLGKVQYLGAQHRPYTWRAHAW